MAELDEVFGRINEIGTVDILFIEDGERVNQLNANVYVSNPNDDDVHAKQHHINGIQLTLSDAKSLGITIE